MIAQTPTLAVTWEKLPDDYVLPDDPVDNINQPALAAALTESLQLAGQLAETAITFTKYGICATVNGKMVVKAPDWGYVPAIRVDRLAVDRSYTPQLQGDLPTIVMEFLSETAGTEYSSKPTYPPGKWFFYEQVLQVPNYAIFDLQTGLPELYRLNATGRYELEPTNDQQRFAIPEMDLELGVWRGSRENRTGDWLRWWDKAGNLLLWGGELVEQQQRQIEQQQRQIEQEQQQSRRLAEKLRSLGLDPEQI